MTFSTRRGLAGSPHERLIAVEAYKPVGELHKKLGTLLVESLEEWSRQ